MFITLKGEKKGMYLYSNAGTFFLQNWVNYSDMSGYWKIYKDKDKYYINQVIDI